MHVGVAPLMGGTRVQNIALSMGLDFIAFRLPHDLSACEGPAVSAQPRSLSNRDAKAAAVETNHCSACGWLRPSPGTTWPVPMLKATASDTGCTGNHQKHFNERHPPNSDGTWDWTTE